MNDDQDDQGQTRYEATFDMATVRDFGAFSDRLHDLMSDYNPQKAGSGLSSQRVRLCLDVPAEWLMLALWMHERQR